MSNYTIANRYGGWLPQSHTVYQSFINEHLTGAALKQEAAEEHVPAVAAFEKAIRSNSVMLALFNTIFLQDSETSTIPDFDTLLFIMDDIVVKAPGFHIPPAGEKPEPLSTPLYIVLDLLSNTGAAYDLFRMREFNIAMKALLDSWGAFLKTNASNNTLTAADDGWFGKFGIVTLEADGRGKFNNTYITPDPEAVNRGYKSWDEFFTRQVQKAARPILKPEDQSLIHNACESRVYRIAHKVKEHDQFWLKAQSYSLYDMLNIGAERDAYVKKFIGGTVYQAYLNPQDYHRWHCPIDGTIEFATVVDGTYYAVLPDAGAEAGDPDFVKGDPRGAIIRSQAWLTMNATRAIIFIRATNDKIGLMCFIGVGMVEVSTCEVTVKRGQEVKKGDQLGMFHFGGSSHSLIFGPHVNITFAAEIVKDKHVQVNSIIAQVS
ncbi:hypothetical protein CVT25_010404 [Psilocybe cyanescens]|uniref:L-tryptophan decarboxylase PsiD-like domain-containing protein n=1 Tax=Psilocybe cyanescens TaxID=93625 RepID=A0A409X2P3_PSICY|nr:hypothetical protein CVT25_010404 [Psilocybe cyanescens]